MGRAVCFYGDGSGRVWSRSIRGGVAPKGAEMQTVQRSLRQSVPPHTKPGWQKGSVVQQPVKSDPQG